MPRKVISKVFFVREILVYSLMVEWMKRLGIRLSYVVFPSLEFDDSCYRQSDTTKGKSLGITSQHFEFLGFGASSRLALFFAGPTKKGETCFLRLGVQDKTDCSCTPFLIPPRSPVFHRRCYFIMYVWLSTPTPSINLTLTVYIDDIAGAKHLLRLCVAWVSRLHAFIGGHLLGKLLQNVLPLKNYKTYLKVYPYFQTACGLLIACLLPPPALAFLGE